jgi:hypothetical protein
MVLLVVMALGACATQPQFTLLGPGRHSIGGAYSVEPQRSWSRLVLDQSEVWTIDGPLLDELHLIHGLADGNALLPAGGEQRPPVYRQGMAPGEIMELVTDSLVAAGAVDVEPTGLRPVDFGTLPGFRFELRYLDAAGLAKQGFAVGTVRDDRLHLVLFTAAREHYFPLHRGTVERLIGSIVVS